MKQQFFNSDKVTLSTACRNKFVLSRLGRRSRSFVGRPLLYLVFMGVYELRISGKWQAFRYSLSNTQLSRCTTVPGGYINMWEIGHVIAVRVVGLGIHKRFSVPVCIQLNYYVWSGLSSQREFLIKIYCRDLCINTTLCLCWPLPCNYYVPPK